MNRAPGAARLIEAGSPAEIYIGKDLTTNQPCYLSMDVLTQTHMHILGSSGSGKTSVTKVITRNFLQHAIPFAQFEIEGPLHESTMDYLAWNPSLAENVVEFNLSDPQGMWPGLNPLARFEHSPKLDVHVQHLLSAFAAVWAEEGKSTPLLRRMLRNILFCLIEHRLTLMESDYLLELGSSDIRQRLALGTSNLRVRKDLLRFDAMRPAQQLDQIGSIQNRLAEFVDSEALQLVMRTDNVLDIKDIVENRKTLLINLSQEGGLLYQDSAFLVAALLVSMFVAYALTRSEQDGKARPYFLVLDEGQNFVAGPYLGKLLDQARKRGLFILFAHQHLAQLYEQDRWLYHSIMSNARIKFLFAIDDADDLETMEKQVFIGEHDLLKIKRQGFHDQEAAPEYWSLPELRYLNQVKLHEQETGQAILTLPNQLHRAIQVDRVEDLPRDESRLAKVRQMIWKNNAQYYLHEDAIQEIIAQRRHQLEAPDNDEEDLQDFVDTNRANFRR